MKKILSWQNENAPSAQASLLPESRVLLHQNQPH
jgi:hypothetical protein